ncbi:MAG: hypothetical protein WA810_04480 [Maribacter sp.]
MRIIFFSLLLSGLLGCVPDDEPAIIDSSLNGEWTLTSVSCFCYFEPENDFTLTKLIFDAKNDKLTVIQNGKYEYFREAGEYSYGGQADRIGFSDNTVYRFEVYGDVLTLTFQDDPLLADDEIVYVLKR